MNNYSELSQASDKVLISIIEKLFSHYRTTQDRSLLDTEGDPEQQLMELLPPEQSTRNSDSQSYTSCVEYAWWEEQTRLETVERREREEQVTFGGLVVFTT